MKFKNWWLGPIGILYDIMKYKEEKKDARAKMQADALKTNANKAQVAEAVYNYNLNDSTTGNTLFDSQKKTKRTIFGAGA